MKCLRCGYCCHALSVIIVDDPTKGITEDNLKHHAGGKRCPHLLGNKVGEFSCSLHEKSWYKETPCFAHDQISKSPSDPCRMGVAFTSGKLDPASFLS